jgi:hypothetical protein
MGTDPPTPHTLFQKGLRWATNFTVPPILGHPQILKKIGYFETFFAPQYNLEEKQILYHHC